jgi:hypothetical protein
MRNVTVNFPQPVKDLAEKVSKAKWNLPHQNAGVGLTITLV